ncbi:MAG: pseudaminic acid cytidylyltransferase [Marinobacter sp.]|nr:pseudaminic acid cytidylyltransferase [Marinobacter sp.]
MKVAIIPARGGSKRIPRKNIKPFCGKPMIAWTIEAAIKSHCFDRILVSTDDREIAEVANTYGAETPFIRPAGLSDDHAGTMPVIAHAIETLAHPIPDLVCCIYATAPFIAPENIQLGERRLLDSDANYAFSVTSYPFPIQRAIRMTPDERVEMFYPEEFSKRSQDLEEAWHDAGQFYWGKASAWLEQRPVFDHGSVPVKLPRHQVQDIDTPEDWLRAEWMFKSMILEKTNPTSPI